MPSLTSRDRILLTLQIELFISNRFRRGEGPTQTETILDQFSVPVEIIQEILEMMVTEGHLLVTDEPRPGHVPSRSLDKLRIRDVIKSAFHNKALEEADQDGLATDALGRDLVGRFEKAAFQSLGDEDIAACLEPLFEK